MAIRPEDYLEKLPNERREEIERKAEELIAEEVTVQQLRRARERTHEKLARTLGVNQAAVSKLECRTDMYVSTLRGLIEAMGGTLEIVVRLPGRPPMRISQFGSLGGDDSPQR